MSKEVIKKNVSFAIPEVVYDQAVNAAKSGGLSLAAFAKIALMAYVRKWKAPAGSVAGAGMACTQCSNRPASQCSNPLHHKDMWVLQSQLDTD